MSNSPIQTGSLQVTIIPTNAVSAGAQWRIDDGPWQNSGAIVTDLPLGTYTVSFSTVSGWTTPASLLVPISSNSRTTATGSYIAIPQTGSLQVTVTPSNVVSAGAQWQVDNGAWQNSGVTLSNLADGTYLVVFGPALGWQPPVNQYVTISNGLLTTLNGTYASVPFSSNWPIFVTNGSGTISKSKNMSLGKKYTVKAVANARNCFVEWVGGTNQPYALLGTNISYVFTNEVGLLLEANFITNVFFGAEGAYDGLFAPTNTERDQTNSGSFTINLTSSGAVSGTLHIGSQSVTLSGKFQPDASATICSKRKGLSTLTTSLQLDLPGETIEGTMSDGSFVAQLTGYQDVFNSHNKATAYKGKYTLIIQGTTNPALGPYGTSYGAVTVSNNGGISFAGSLADGTPVSQSSVVSQDGWWPMYINLYGGKGSLWAWNQFTNGGLATNTAVSWINETNSSKTAACRVGFTNQAAVLVGSRYSPTNEPLLGFTNGEVILDLLNWPSALSNGVTIAGNNKIETNSTGDIRKLKLTANKTNGVISGCFANPSNSKQTNKVNGVILQGQANAQGYFIESNQSGVFTLTPQ
jgi:hypothetical protein